MTKFVNKKRIVIITSLSTVIIIVLTVFLIIIFKKMTAYNESMEFIKNSQYNQAIETLSTIINFKDSRQQIGKLQARILLKETICEDLHYNNHTKALESIKSMDLESINYCKRDIEDSLLKNLQSFRVSVNSLDEIDYEKFEFVKAITELIDFSDTYKGQNIIKYTDNILKLKEYEDVNLFQDTLGISGLVTADFYMKTVLKYMSAQDWSFYDSLSKSALQELKVAISTIKPYNSFDSKKYVSIIENQYAHLVDMHNALCDYNKKQFTVAMGGFENENNNRKDLINKYEKLEQEVDLIVKDLPDLK